MNMIDRARTEALFASSVQISDNATDSAVRAAVSGACRKFGVRGCAGAVATAFGDYPYEARDRMAWAIGVVAHVYHHPRCRHAEALSTARNALTVR